MHNRLAIIRNSLNIAQIKFGDKLGIAPTTYVKYERGERKPSYEVLEILYKNYNVNLNWLITGEGEMFNVKQSVAQQDDKLWDEVSKLVDERLKQKGII